MGAQDRWRIEFFTTTAGRCPVQEYIEKLSTGEATRLMRGIHMFDAAGTDLGPPHLRFLGDKLWELRVTGRSQHRVLYFAASGRRLVLLHAFTKKTRRTPSAEIAVARTRMAEYLGRKKHGMA